MHYLWKPPITKFCQTPTHHTQQSMNWSANWLAKQFIKLSTLNRNSHNPSSIWSLVGRTLLKICNISTLTFIKAWLPLKMIWRISMKWDRHSSSWISYRMDSNGMWIFCVPPNHHRASRCWSQSNSLIIKSKQNIVCAELRWFQVQQANWRKN